MFISLSRLPADGLAFNHQYAANELDISEHEFELAGFPLVSGRVDRAGMDMRVRGTVKSALVVTCDRCLTEIEVQVDAPFDLIYVPEDPASELAGETELHDRDLDLVFYQNEQINVDDLVLEQLELSLPTRVLCKEDCRGLCSQCGADLNIEQCQCRKPIDPRWQALADLQDQNRDQ